MKVKVLVAQLLFVIPWTVAHQAPLYMGFPRQEHWNVLPFPSLGNLHEAGIKLRTPVSHADSLPSELPGQPAKGEWRSTNLAHIYVFLHSYKPKMDSSCSIVTRVTLWDNGQSCIVSGHPLQVEEVIWGESIYKFLGSHQQPGSFVSGLEEKGIEN